MNTKNTELQKSFCEMKNFENEPLNVSAVSRIERRSRAANYFNFSFFFTILCKSASRRSL
jgi:hypothetical protein